MPETVRLNGYSDQIELGFVEREVTPEPLMKLSIRLHLSSLSLSNTISILELFGVERARSTVSNWVHKANLQPKEGRNPDHVAVDETVTRLNSKQYWLYTAVDPETNKILHSALEPTRKNGIAQQFFHDLRQKHSVEDAVFLIDGSASLQAAVARHSLDYRYEKHGKRNSVERVFRDIKRRTTAFSNCFSNTDATTADEWLKTFAFAWNQLI
ncbi:IS6 family transposase [Halolamina salifodinae]|uniref:Transposase-like protein n=1 Tax=Halolamina salifodinae TaxID=1202767 RepID=A0A8T4GXR6_9EURY|nr:IS6 family transposase [Halolamina salifodinae]MBP1986893.1 transposase-like protein [Halolamina salifodinae]